MKENLKKFLEEASKNEELKAKLAAITDKDTAAAKVIEIAKEYGYTLTAEDLKLDKDDKLSLDELENAAGGFLVEKLNVFKKCFCFSVSEAEQIKKALNINVKAEYLYTPTELYEGGIGNGSPKSVKELLNSIGLSQTNTI